MRKRTFFLAAALSLFGAAALAAEDAPAADGATGHNLMGRKSLAVLVKIAADGENVDQLRALTDLAAAKVDAPEFVKILPGVYRG
ncbi:MAG: hypothetical protein J6333_07620, partial [Planctomycetes bacterium]|nr:hypothetical protein [Planctomycetota bacterium]